MSCNWIILSWYHDIRFYFMSFMFNHSLMTWMHLPMITHYCVTVVVVEEVAVLLWITITFNEKSISMYHCTYNLWHLYFQNIDAQPFRSVIMTPKVTWHDIQGHMILEQWIEYVSYIFESENHTLETVYMF